MGLTQGVATFSVFLGKMLLGVLNISSLQESLPCEATFLLRRNRSGINSISLN